MKNIFTQKISIQILLIATIYLASVSCQDCDPILKTTDISKYKLQFNLSLSIPDEHCTQYEIPLNYKQADIEIQSESIRHYIISDKPISKCSSSYFEECPEDSTICIRSLQNIEKVSKHKIGLCMQKLYVTVLTECKSPEGQSNGTIKATLQNKSGCQKIEDTQEIQCAQYKESDCSNPDFNLCKHDCFWTQCKINDQEVFGSCLPVKKYKEFEQYNACRADYDWAMQEEKDKTKISVTPKWCGDIPPGHLVIDLQNGSQHMNWWQHIIMLIVILFFMFLCTVCGYRHEVATGNQPPFTPPNCCPNWVYPRVDLQNMDYIPQYAQQQQQSQINKIKPTFNEDEEFD